MASRDIGYTNAEDVIPHENYLEITQDPIVGRYQTTDHFLERVDEVYHERVGKITSTTQLDRCNLT